MTHDTPANALPQPPCPICATAAHYEYSGRDLMYEGHIRYDYFLCPACAFVFQHPVPDMATIATFYPDTYMVYDQDKRERRLGRMRKALLARVRGYAHLRTDPATQLAAALVAPFATLSTPAWCGGGRLLDVGCGNGRFLTTMRSLGWSVQGVEFSEAGVQACRMSGLDVHLGDLSSAAFADGSFELITVRHVIEHVPDPQAFMAELARILKPGGRLVVETPNSDALGRRWFGNAWYANDVPRHLALYAPGNLEQLGTRYGLRKQECRLETSPKIFLNSLDYLTGNVGVPSKRIGWKRLLARVYVRRARRTGRGDTLQMTFVKPS